MNYRPATNQGKADLKARAEAAERLAEERGAFLVKSVDAAQRLEAECERLRTCFAACEVARLTEDLLAAERNVEHERHMRSIMATTITKAESECAALRAAVREKERLELAASAEADELRADRDEWRTQHESLLVMYQRSVAEVAALKTEWAEHDGVPVLERENAALRAALSIAQEAGEELRAEVELQRQAGTEHMRRADAAESRLATATALLRRWLPVTPPRNVGGRRAAIVTDTEAYLAAQPAAPGSPAWNDELSTRTTLRERQPAAPVCGVGCDSTRTCPHMMGQPAEPCDEACPYGGGGPDCQPAAPARTHDRENCDNPDCGTCMFNAPAAPVVKCPAFCQCPAHGPAAPARTEECLSCNRELLVQARSEQDVFPGMPPAGWKP